MLRLLTLGESQLTRPINIIDRLQRIANDAWIFRSRRKRLFEEKTMLPGNVIREEEA